MAQTEAGFRALARARQLDTSLPAITYADAFRSVAPREVSADLMAFHLGTGLLPNTGFTPSEVDVWWRPDGALEDSSTPRGLCVYGGKDEAMTKYVATMSRVHLADAPVAVCGPEAGYPDSAAFVDDPLTLDLREYAAVVYDRPHDPAADRHVHYLLRAARKMSVVVLFTASREPSYPVIPVMVRMNGSTVLSAQLPSREPMPLQVAARRDGTFGSHLSPALT